MQISDLGFIYKAHKEEDWWDTHTMAPAPILLNEETIRIYIGCWDSAGISRIGYLDVDSTVPTKVKCKSTEPLLDIGEDGCFDENGVFPGHAYKISADTVYLYYTGFQLGHKIRHYNFGGLAISKDGGNSFQRYSQAPVMDRSDEGLFVRAGQSIELDNSGGYHMVYSGGSDWAYCKGEYRPVYDVFYQHSKDGIETSPKGKKIVSCDLDVEHGLGRPQIVKLGEYYYVFYTRRILEDMKYFIGASRSIDCVHWERCDELFDGIAYGDQGDFNSDMIYFPSVVKTSERKAFLFYVGNYFGRDGMGVMEICI